jgi:peptidoglycan/LPS O-acetylase OafA/YrhL
MTITKDSRMSSAGATVCITLIAVSIIIATCMYYLTDRRLMAANIENAISKGIDPLSVRCSYAKSDDIICVAYASAAPTSSKK